MYSRHGSRDASRWYGKYESRAERSCHHTSTRHKSSAVTWCHWVSRWVRGCWGGVQELSGEYNISTRTIERGTRWGRHSSAPPLHTVRYDTVSYITLCRMFYYMHLYKFSFRVVYSSSFFLMSPIWTHQLASESSVTSTLSPARKLSSLSSAAFTKTRYMIL
jgi:hypothetical protein